MHIEGFMSGSLFPELSGSSFIRSSTGYTAKIDYICKGWLSGKRNGFTATLFKDGKEKEPIYKLEGQWSDSWTCKEVKTQKEVQRFDINSLQRTPLQVAPIENQHPLESRRAWQHVVAAIHKGDIFTIGHEKSKIENEQREMRKREKGKGSDFPRRYFSQAKKDPIAEKLAEGIKGEFSLKGEMDGQHCLWMWDEEKYRRVQGNMFNGVKSPTRTRFDSGVGGIIMDSTGSCQ